MEPITVRPFADADVLAVVELWKACGLEHTSGCGPSDIDLCRTSGHGDVLVAEDGGALVGSVMVGHDGHRGWMYYVAVDPRRRKSGIGRRLIAAAEGWLRARGIPKALLLVRDTNREVVGFYERLGYEVQPRFVLARWLGSE